MFAMIIVNAPVLLNIFHDNVDELNGILKEAVPNDTVAKAKLRNIEYPYSIWIVQDYEIQKKKKKNHFII